MSQSVLDVEFNSLNYRKTTISSVTGACQSTKKRLKDREFENQIRFSLCKALSSLSFRLSFNA